MEGLPTMPPGFRFHPTEEIVSYVRKKVVDQSFNAVAIVEVDLNKCEPWDLASKAKIGENVLYFYHHKFRKYSKGTRTNRATHHGHWKATGKDKAIKNGDSKVIGMKKTLVFHLGRAPKGEKTDWVMHEFRLEGEFYKNLKGTRKDEWVVCKVILKSPADRSSDHMITTKNDPIMPSFPEIQRELYDPRLILLPSLVDLDTITPDSIFNNNNSSCTIFSAAAHGRTSGLVDFSPDKTCTGGLVQFTSSNNPLEGNFDHPDTRNQPSSPDYHPQDPVISTTTFANPFVNDFPFSIDHHLPKMQRNQYSIEDFSQLVTSSGSFFSDVKKLLDDISFNNLHYLK